jgi:hypothetical protein
MMDEDFIEIGEINNRSIFIVLPGFFEVILIILYPWKVYPLSTVSLPPSLLKNFK